MAISSTSSTSIGNATIPLGLDDFGYLQLARLAAASAASLAVSAAPPVPRVADLTRQVSFR